VSTVAFDVAATRAQFPALAGSTVFFDGPGGTQVPQSVIDAMAACMRDANANVGGPFETSHRVVALLEAGHEAAARFLGASPQEVGFGHNMTTLNFALTRALGRELQAGDEIVVTRLDHDGNVAPWLELARDLDLVVRRADFDVEDGTLDLDDLAAQLSGKTRVVAFPWASNALGTVTPVQKICELAHEAEALAWVDAVHYAPHGPINVAEVGADVLICSPYKFFGPHLGLFFGRRELLERWRPYKVRPAADEPVAHRFETGTLSHEAIAGTIAAIEYLESLGWEAIQAHERELGGRFLTALPEPYRIHGPPTMDGRVPTFSLTHRRRKPDEIAAALGDQGMATWPGNFYAVEVMERLGLSDGTLRIGFVHYNTAEEVDRLLAALEELA
jgi:cysteine desulfurase family protein (TIGR01976 family)